MEAREVSFQLKLERVTIFNLTTAEAKIQYHIIKPERTMHLKRDSIQGQLGLHASITVEPP
jgi:hypothetical protein